MDNKKNKSKIGKLDSHLVIICDEEGIYEAFNLVKESLVVEENIWLSFIYATSERNGHPLFEQELSILEYRFFEYLLVYSPKIEFETSCFKQELLEAIINSNLSPKIEFILFGSNEFVDHADGLLRYLDISSESIKTNIKI